MALLYLSGATWVSGTMVGLDKGYVWLLSQPCNTKVIRKVFKDYTKRFPFKDQGQTFILSSTSTKSGLRTGSASYINK